MLGSDRVHRRRERSHAAFWRCIGGNYVRIAHVSKTRWMVFAGFVAAFLVAIYWHYFSRASIPRETIRLDLRLTASSIYEFQNATGRWPKVIDDLAATSLVQIRPYLMSLIDNARWPLFGIAS